MASRAVRWSWKMSSRAAVFEETAKAIETQKITKRYASLLAVASVDFDIKVGEIHGLVGANGAGKSSFTKILAGAISADSGQIYINGKEVSLSSPREGRALGIVAIQQELAMLPDRSVLANVFLGNELHKGPLIDLRAMAKRYDELTRTFGLSIPKAVTVGSLSIADCQKVEILRAVQAHSKVLILDEPSAVLDPSDRQALYNVIRQLVSTGTAIIFISHDLDEVLTICDRVSVMRDGALIETRRAVDWTAEGLVDGMLGAAKKKVTANARPAPGSFIFGADSICLPGRLEDVSFDVRRGEILGIAGLIGSGRSELLRAIFGAEPKATGRIQLDGHTQDLPRSPRHAMARGIAMVPEDRKLQGLILHRNGYFNIGLGNTDRIARAGIIRRSTAKHRFDHAANAVKLAKNRLGSEAVMLSGGNQQKVLLARWLDREPKLLLLDEPTRGVDVAAREEIYASIIALASCGTSIVLVSSDLEETVRLSDRILVLKAGRSLGILSRGEADIESVLRLKFSVDRRTP